MGKLGWFICTPRHKHQKDVKQRYPDRSKQAVLAGKGLRRCSGDLEHLQPDEPLSTKENRTTHVNLGEVEGPGECVGGVARAVVVQDQTFLQPLLQIVFDLHPPWQQQQQKIIKSQFSLPVNLPQQRKMS